MKTFFLNLIRKDMPESSKRFFGGIGFVCCVFVICIFKQEYLRELLYTSATLLGIGITDSLISKIKEK
ncbi:MAG: hypothetical protein WCK78_04150 [Paludibacter sp.]